MLCEAVNFGRFTGAVCREQGGAEQKIVRRGIDPPDLSLFSELSTLSREIS